MPRGKIKLDCKLETLAILDAEGNADEALEPKIEAADLRRLFRGMLASRRFDERMLKLQRQGRIGTYGPSVGQEAASLGPAFAIGRKDWFVPAFRETAGMLWRGWPMSKIILWWSGNEEGAKVPEGYPSVEFTADLLDQVGGAVTPGIGNGKNGEGYVRLSLTISDASLVKGLSRLSGWRNSRRLRIKK